MQTHFISWQSRGVANAPQISDQASIADRSFAPVAHVTRQRRLFRRINVGDSIWIAGRYPMLSDAAGSLIGRIDVADKTMEGSVLRFAASPESYWLPWNDASRLMMSLAFNNKGMTRALDLNVGIAQQLQTTREIASPFCEVLETYASAVRHRPMIFVSYRWALSSDVMRFLLPALEAIGCSVWIDRWSGPRRFKEGRANQPKDTVKMLLSKAIGHCHAMFAIVDSDYHTGEWTSFEYTAASTIGVPIHEFSGARLRQIYEEGGINEHLRQIIQLKKWPSRQLLIS
ncbi:toll/interleukin-1 receptor domain-containing protein [Mesorhizobium sp. VK4C]|uniref:toll/interleukin-1 receptor domain-containing protein n=1 Tax=Mesorhizobium captivum TaxID=3072319 RepID=UPI002A23F48B|nr:toll/interleukin-1 receptor domain-containing protein [Mesorhizobium sp. VK4C]MDX8501921.1 toll/interleukin-1 receptor domain-containing protein [Mesorhizobium sp. VK4C]